MSEGAVQLNFVILAFCSPLRKSWNLFSKNKLTPNKQVTFIAEPHCNGALGNYIIWCLNSALVMYVVSYELVCYERVCFERVCYERGLLWTYMVCYERCLLWTGLFMNLVCFEWSVMSGLLWTALLWTDTIRNIQLLERNIHWKKWVENIGALLGHNNSNISNFGKIP